MTKLENEKIWMLLILAWLSNADEETIQKIKLSHPQNDEELRNSTQQKISDSQEELSKYENN